VAQKKKFPKHGLRDLFFQFRINRWERQQIRKRAKAAGKTPTEYVRDRVFVA